MTNLTIGPLHECSKSSSGTQSVALAERLSGWIDVGEPKPKREASGFCSRPVLADQEQTE